MSVEYNKVETKEMSEVDKPEEVTTEVRTIGKLSGEVKVTQPKKGLVTRLFSSFLGPDGISKIGSHLGKEIILPAVKEVLVDTITSAVNIAVYGERGSRAGGSRRVGGHRHVDYTEPSRVSRVGGNSNWGPAQARQEVPIPMGTRGHRNVVEYILDSRSLAMETLTILQEAASAYGMVSAADYYELIGVPYNYTENDFGWTEAEISSSVIMPMQGGYIIKFPQVHAL